MYNRMGISKAWELGDTCIGLRGNWAPEVVRNLILRYSKEKDHLLDCMIGGGTTAIEAKILNRHITCTDVNQDALDRTLKSLEFEVDNKSSSEW